MAAACAAVSVASNAAVTTPAMPAARQLLRGGVQRGGGSPGEHDAAQAGTRQLLDSGDRDLAAAPEDEDRLGLTEGIHHRDSLLDWSEVKTPLGSIASRTRCHSDSRGYDAAIIAGDMRESLAR